MFFTTHPRKVRTLKLGKRYDRFECTSSDSNKPRQFIPPIHLTLLARGMRDRGCDVEVLGSVLGEVEEEEKFHRITYLVVLAELVVRARHGAVFHCYCPRRQCNTE